MTSLLAKEIYNRKDQALEVHAPRVIDYFLRIAEESAGELDTNFQEISVIIYALDDDLVWESIRFLTEALTEQQLKNEVGFNIVFTSSTEATLKWSGV